MSDKKRLREQILVPSEFCSIPYCVLAATQLTPADKLVYVALLSPLGNNDFVWPSYSTIGKETGLARSTVLRAVRRLLELGLILQQDSGRPSNGYTFSQNIASLLLDATTGSRRQRALQDATSSRTQRLVAPCNTPSSRTQRPVAPRNATSSKLLPELIQEPNQEPTHEPTNEIPHPGFAGPGVGRGISLDEPGDYEFPEDSRLAEIFQDRNLLILLLKYSCRKLKLEPGKLNWEQIVPTLSRSGMLSKSLDSIGPS